MGDAPVHASPVEKRYDTDEAIAATSGHHHRIHIHRGREKRREKELAGRQGSNATLQDSYKHGLRLHLDGTASSHSSQTRLFRSGSPTPSIASSMSNNRIELAPQSPDEVGSKEKGRGRGLFSRLGISKDKDKGGDNKRTLKPKASESMINSGAPNSVISDSTPRDGSSSEHMNPRAYDFASTPQLLAKKKEHASRRGFSDAGKDPRGLGRKSKNGSLNTPMEYRIDTSFSDQASWLKQGVETQLPEAVSWEPPESWATLGMDPTGNFPPDEEPNDDSGGEDSHTVGSLRMKPVDAALTGYSTAFGYSARTPLSLPSLANCLLQ